MSDEIRQMIHEAMHAAFESLICTEFSDHDESVMWARGVAGAARDLSFDVRGL